MHEKELDASDELRNCIRGFWYRKKDFGTSLSMFEVLPDGHAEIIFHFGSGCNIMHEGRVEVLTSPFIVGLLGKPVYFYAKGSLQFIGVKCFPWSVYDLLNLQSVKGGVQSLIHPIALLQLRLNELLDVGNIDEALEIVRDWFVNVNRTMAAPAELSKAGKVMSASNGSLPVSSVAAAAHATIRTLERKFKASSGHTVKDVSGLMRFEHARDYLWNNPDAAISNLAHELGFADQSHLNREFKRYCGITAGTFAKRVKARRKDLGDDFVAIVLSY